MSGQFFSSVDLPSRKTTLIHTDYEFWCVLEPVRAPEGEKKLLRSRESNALSNTFPQLSSPKTSEYAILQIYEKELCIKEQVSFFQQGFGTFTSKF
jgi:hypothetical protein